MTVNELIEALEQFPGGHLVGVRNPYWGTYEAITEARLWRETPADDERVELVL